MAQCWKCGGQMPAYAARCGWCGRSTTVSAFLQVLSIAVIAVGGLVIAGVVPLSSITRHIPGLAVNAGLPQAPLSAEAGAAEPAPAPGSPSAPRTAGREVEESRSRADAEQRRRDQERSDRQQPATSSQSAGPGTQALTSGPASCESPDRVDALARAHADWSRADLLLISCGKVAEGFTTKQVIAALGRPRSVNRPSGASQVEEWVYRNQRLVMERGTVVSVRK
jgi:hypothetical protein